MRLCVKECASNTKKNTESEREKEREGATRSCSCACVRARVCVAKNRIQPLLVAGVKMTDKSKKRLGVGVGWWSPL